MIDLIGGPDRDRTDDLFHAMEARSQLRHRPTYSGLQLPYCLRSEGIRQTLARMRVNTVAVARKSIEARASNMRARRGKSSLA